jgi:sigma-E factor negative regulatory protein RseB
MSKALAEQNYEGRFVRVRDSRSETMRIFHRVDRGKVSERLVSLDGSGREIIRNETEVICYLPDKRTVVVEKRTEKPVQGDTLLAGFPSYSPALESLYDIEKVGGVIKTLGRKTQVVLVQPRDHFRYGYRLWLDQETALPLKSQLCDRQGRVIEQILFSEVNLRDRISAADLRPAVSGEGYTWLRQTTEPPMLVGTPTGWVVSGLPAGFRLTAVRIQVIAGSPMPVRHLVYSDGLAAVSVFIEPRDAQAPPMRGLARVGAAFAFSRNLDGHQVIAVGEVPAATVEAIGAGVTRATAQLPSNSTPLDQAPSNPPVATGGPGR